MLHSVNNLSLCACMQAGHQFRSEMEPNFFKSGELSCGGVAQLDTCHHSKLCLKHVATSVHHESNDLVEVVVKTMKNKQTCHNTHIELLSCFPTTERVSTTCRIPDNIKFSRYASW